MCNNEEALYASEAYSSPISPPPFMVGMAEVEIDKETGELELIDYVAVVDCGTVVNPSLARVQTEGGLAQGIGMAMYEDVIYNAKRQKITAIPLCSIKSQAVWMWAISGWNLKAATSRQARFGAKSIGEIVINTPFPCDCKCSQPCGRSKSERTSDHRRKSILGGCRKKIKKNLHIR